jgi:hypothetical protein
MARKKKAKQSLQPQLPTEAVAVPIGVPSWITSPLIAQTLKTWQPYYRTPLTLDDAVTMLLNVGRLFRELSRGSS